ncbi:hypothetical protein L208DRAFT_1277242, partial [Tricholoma matsutake]
KLNKVVHIIGKGFRLKVIDNMSTDTIGRVMREGGVAAEIQIVHEIEEAKVSGDGTSIKHLNYEAKHITLPVPSYAATANLDSHSKPVHATCSFGISHAPNHTSEM